MATLELIDVKRAFGGVKAVDGVSFCVEGGRITGLIGPNGSGKSTLINLVTGVLALSGGDVRINGQSIAKETADVVARHGIARTFQNIRLLAEASVLENVMIGFHRLEQSSWVANLFGLPSSRRETREMRARALTLLDQFGMTDFANLAAGSLAYGHQRRVEIMRAAASSPDVLLLDEPVAGMNDVEAGELGTIFRTLADRGTAVLLIEHNTRFVASLCQEVHVLDGGRLIAHGSPEQVMRDPAVVVAYMGAD
jgi:branched-chain amino acid transport system ATP-binding protein